MRFTGWKKTKKIILRFFIWNRKSADKKKEGKAYGFLLSDYIGGHMIHNQLKTESGR